MELAGAVSWWGLARSASPNCQLLRRVRVLGAILTLEGLWRLLGANSLSNPMDFQHVLQQRRSVRAYADRVPTQEQLEEIFAALTQAPSAAGLQAYRIHVVVEEDLRRGLAAAAQGQGFVAQAPVVLVFCADTSRAAEHGTPRETHYSVQDALIAMAYAQLAVVEQYLGSCWVGAFDPAQVRTLLQLTENELPVALMPLGYSGADAKEPKRRPLEELIVWHGALKA